MLAGSLVLPPETLRRSKKIPPYAGQSAVLALAEPGSRLLRIMTPAEALEEVPERLTRRAMTLPSPVSGW